MGGSRLFVTGSAKTQHDCTSLNLQYKPMITMCKILSFFKIKFIKFVKCFFLVKKGSSDENLDSILFTYSRGIRKSLFCCIELKDPWVTVVCLHHVETIVRDWFFFIYFVSIHGEGVWYRDKLTQYQMPLLMANTMVQVKTTRDIPFVSYIHFCKRLYQWLLYSLIFLLLPFCRVITPKVVI